MNITPSQFDADSTFARIEEIKSNPALSKFDKKIAMLPFLKRINQEHSFLRSEVKKKDEQIDFLHAVEKGCLAIIEWSKLPSVLEKNDCSRLHKLEEAEKNDRVYFTKKQDFIQQKGGDIFSGIHPFVVQHDWARAFQNAKDYGEGEIRLPFPICAFEFRISGKSIVVWAGQVEDSESEPTLCAYIESNGVWICLEEEAKTNEHFKFAWLEIRAICIALEAEAAIHNLVRAPSKLNAIREKEGKLPLYDYHIINLSQRSLADIIGVRVSGTKKRLHFRRGHWRHFETHRTWIKWMLVGNPELGFIDSEYRL